MWEMMQGLMPRRRNRKNGMGTVTAIVVGAGVGIAAWEMVRRTNLIGNGGESVDQMQNIASDMMNAITD
jgi:hypothetical protein